MFLFHSDCFAVSKPSKIASLSNLPFGGGDQRTYSPSSCRTLPSRSFESTLKYGRAFSSTGSPTAIMTSMFICRLSYTIKIPDRCLGGCRATTTPFVYSYRHFVFHGPTPPRHMFCPVEGVCHRYHPRPRLRSRGVRLGVGPHVARFAGRLHHLPHPPVHVQQDLVRHGWIILHRGLTLRSRRGGRLVSEDTVSGTTVGLVPAHSASPRWQVFSVVPSVLIGIGAAFCTSSTDPVAVV